MLWILRRTGAVNFFNSLNNNCNANKSNNNTTQDKYVKRPPRKAYGRLSAADSDDASSMKQKIDDPFDDIDNFEMISSSKKKTTNNATGCVSATSTTAAGGMANGNHRMGDKDGDDGGGGGGGGDGTLGACTSPDCQGNFVNGKFCDYELTGLCANEENGNGGGAAGGAVGGGGVGGFFKSNSAAQRQKEVNENIINRLQSMAMSDDDDYDESLTCNVCDRAFYCHRQLASHQQKKRHFGCNGCDGLFPSLMLLEHHKEEFEHWSDDELGRRACCRRNRSIDYFTDTDSFTSEAESEDLERLL